MDSDIFRQKIFLTLNIKSRKTMEDQSNISQEQNSKPYLYQNVELREALAKAEAEIEEAMKDYIPFRDREKK